MKKIVKLIFNRWTLIALGLIAVSLLIWWIAPAIHIFGHAPFAPEWVRWTLIALVCVLVIAKAAWKTIRARRASAKLAEGLAEPATPSPSDPSDEEGAVLNERFGNALEVLKKTSLGKAKRSPLARLGSLVTGSYLYDLPWYVIIGAPGSGKTTALLNSGLQFPLAERFGKDGIHGVGGTRNCDWFFTDEAILLDTAGRYTTQESNQDVDASGWRSFMQLLKKARPRRPINGVLLTVSAEELLEPSSAKREAHAAALRRRLRELYSDLGIRFPVYVLVSKVDLLAGFNEYFSVLSKEDREQVWGFSLPYAEQASGLDDVGKQLDLLERRVYARLTTRLREEPDAQKRALMYAFPQQFANANRRLHELLTSVFAPSKYEVTPLLRGAYFTSGTQEGSPIDRISGQLARTFGLERKLLPPQRASGRSYFLTRVLKDLVFAERGLAGTNLKWERRRAFIELGAAACGIGIVLLASTAWFVSYRHNVTYMDAVSARLGEVKQQVEAIPGGTVTDVLSLLPTLDSVRSLSQTRASEDGSVPWSYKFGLYQGSKLETASEHAYERLLQATFLPSLVGRLEAQLRSGFTGNSDLTYEALKSYIMLNEHKRFDESDLQAWFTLDWEAMMSRDVTNEQRKELHEHLAALYRDGWVQPPSMADEELKTQVRRSIGVTPLPQRIYARLRRLNVAKDAPDFAISPRIEGAELMFARASGAPLTKGIPGLFTFDGYHKSFAKEAERAAKRLAVEEQWVMAGSERSDIASFLGSQATVVNDAVKGLYLDDYREQWSAYLKDLTIASKPTLVEKIQLAQLLSDPSPNNPLKRLFTAIAHEVTLAEKPKEDKDLLQKAEDRTRSTLKDLSNLVPGMPKEAGVVQTVPLEKTLVDDHFRNVREFVVPAIAGQPAPIDGAITLMNEIYAMLIGIKKAGDEGIPPPPSPTAENAAALAARYPEPLRSMVSSLTQSTQAISGRELVRKINRELRPQVTDFCVKALTQRYPFVASNHDVTQEDFVTLFGPGGKLDNFYQQQLLAVVETSGEPWRFKPHYQGMTLQPEGNDLDQFRKAKVIREVFFPGGSRTPSSRFEFKPIEMDASIEQFTLDVDGQLLKYAHGPQVPMTVNFPGPKGSMQVRVAISPPTASGNSGFVLEGPWALFRLFQSVRVENTAGQAERFRATIAVDDRKTVFDVTAKSVQNPLGLKELTEFRCPQAL
jgi:type VI secretion system protein ImpL